MYMIPVANTNIWFMVCIPVYHVPVYRKGIKEMRLQLDMVNTCIPYIHINVSTG